MSYDSAVQKKPVDWEARRVALIEYVRENPNATTTDIDIDGHRRALEHFYHHNLNVLKKELGLPERKARGGWKRY